MVRAAPSVRYTTFMGIWVDKPNALSARAPVGMMRALSLLLMAIAIASVLGFNSPIKGSVSRRAYIPRATREISPFSAKRSSAFATALAEPKVRKSLEK